jgi:predicted RNase H-like nuclease (RuvC/YqgF family)
MTTAAELAAQTACADLRIRLENAQQVVEARDKTINRLNALLVPYERRITELENQCDDLEAKRAKLLREVFECDGIITARNCAIARLEAELAEARAGVVALPY